MPSGDVLLHGFGFSGYRSFIEPGVPIAPLGKVTLLAGQNNAGKSNALRFMRELLKPSPDQPADELDRPQNVLPQDWRIQLRLVAPGLRVPEWLRHHMDLSDVRRVLEAVTTGLRRAGTDFVEVPFMLVGAGAPGGADRSPRRWLLDGAAIQPVVAALVAAHIDPMQAINRFGNQNYVSGGSASQFTAELLNLLTPPPTELPEVRIIQAFRQIRPKPPDGDEDVGLFNGVGIVERLQQLQNPRETGKAREELQEKYERINRFVRHILGDDSATLRIPYDATTVQVERGRTVLPLDSLGTGVHQVVMLAAASTLLSDTVVGLEEPEVHLHPLLQRRLVRYLVDHTDNQYVIATHSAHLLDYEYARVFHLTYGQSGTEVAPAGTPHELAAVCADLGYRPSDLLQSNAVVWVEGPSDRLYIRHWLRMVADYLVEGVHYSIMFYGGGLLNHVTPDDPRNPGLAIEYHNAEIDDFISLRRLNRHLAIVIDSDKSSPRKWLNATKQRVRDAFDNSDGPGFAWVTDCYTIENYLPRALLEGAVAAVHPRWTLLPDEGVWKNPLRFEGGRSPDKVAVARYVTDNWAGDLSHLRLDRRISQLVSMIRAANGHTDAD